LLLLFIHLGASIRTLVSRNELGAFWYPMTMNGCCYLKHGLLGPSRWSQSPKREMAMNPAKFQHPFFNAGLWFAV
jgi:hypothetical protein